jgi:uncharacterized protein (TIGR00369 family)
MQERFFPAPFTYQACNPEYEALVHKKLEGQHLYHHLGWKLNVIEPGYIELYTPLHKLMEQQDGLLHGGMTAVLGDMVTGFAAFTLVEKDDRVVTADLKVSYFSPGRGEAVLARGWVIKPGKRLQYCEGEIYIQREGQLHLIAKTYSVMATIHGKQREFENLKI